MKTTAVVQPATEDQNTAFCRRLRALMDSKLVTQQELAIRIGCTQPAVSQLLQRAARPRKITILKIAEALNVSPRDLWPDLEVVEMLDTAAAFAQDEHTMTAAEAAALRSSARRNLPTIPARSLPSRKK